MRLLFLLILFPGSLLMAQNVAVDNSACREIFSLVDGMKNGLSRTEIENKLDRVLATEPYRVMFRHYNRPFRPNHLPETVFRRMILSIKFPAEYTIGENERADQMLPYWKDFYNRTDYYRVSLRLLQSENFVELLGEGISKAQNWLPGDMKIPHFSFHIVPHGGSGGFAIDGVQSLDFFQIERNPGGEISTQQIVQTISHEAHHLGINLGTAESATKQDSLALRFLSIFITEGMATKFVDNAPGGRVPEVDPESPQTFDSSALNVWAYYSLKEDSLFKAFDRSLTRIISGELNADSVNTLIYEWLRGHKGAAYFIGSEMLGIIYHVKGKEAVFEVIRNPWLLPELYNSSLGKRNYGLPVLKSVFHMNISK